MAQGTISSELTIATAISKLGEMLAPIQDFTLNITNEVVGRQAKVVVPIVGTAAGADGAARVWDYTDGYHGKADTEVGTLEVSLAECIKPFQLTDNEMNKSPISLASFVKQNAHEFGRFLLNRVFTAVDGASGTGSNTKATSTMTTGNVKAVAEDLDENGAPSDRSFLIAAQANSRLMPTTIETFGANVLESGRFSNLYGMRVYPQTCFNTGTGKAHSFGCSNDAIVVVNRQPEVSGTSTLEEYTPFTIDGLGIQCAYRRYYDAAKGQHFGAFTSMFGVGVAKPKHISKIVA